MCANQIRELSNETLALDIELPEAQARPFATKESA